MRLFFICLISLFVYSSNFAQVSSASTSTVKVIPNVIPAGDTATVRVQLKDANGNDITTGGETIDFGSPSSGSLGAISDNGDGTYTATYTAPSSLTNGQTGSITFVPSLGGTPFTNTDSVTFANVVVKADNANGTAQGNSWVGEVGPTETEIGLFNTTLSESFGTGAPLSWLGLKVSSGINLIYILNPSTENHVGILAGGVDMLEATRDLKIASFQQQADHTWWVPSGRTFTVDLRFTQINNTALSLYGGGTINLPGPGVSPAISTNPIVLGNLSSFTGILNANNHSFALSVPAYETMRFAGTINNTGSSSNIKIEEGGVLDFNNNAAFNFGWDWIQFTSLNGNEGVGGTYTIRNSGTGKVTINPSGNIVGRSDQTLVLGGLGDGEITQSLMSGGASVSLQKDGPGTWTLSNTTNGFSGTTTINDGTLEITGLFGNGTNSVGNYAKSIVNNAELKINSTSNQTLSGVISGTGKLIKDNTGTLTLSGTNTYDGNTTVSGGKLLVSGALAGSSGTYSADLVNNAEVEVNSATNQTYAGTLSGSGNWIKDGSGTWTWDGSNTSTGTLTVKGGSLLINENSSVPTGDIYVLNGALEFNRSSATTFDSKFYIAGTGSAPTFLNNGTGLVTVAPGNESNIGVDSGEPFTIGGSGDIRVEKSVASGGNGALLTKVGAGTVTLVSTANNYSGGTTISEGVLQIGDGTNNGTIGSGTITLTNGRLSFNRVNPYTVEETFASFQDGTTPGIENNGAGLLTVNASNLGFNIGSNGITLELGGTGDGVVDGPIASGGAAANILKDGSGTWIFNDPETNYSGSTTINAGTLEITGRLGKGTYGQSIVNNTELNINSASDQTLSGVISGTGALYKTGSGTLTLIGNSSYTGGTTFNAGTLTLGNDNALGTGDLTIAGTGLTLSTNAALTIPNAIILNNNATIANGTHAFTANGAITGTGKLTKTGTGTLTLNGNSNYSGGTEYSAGSLILGNDNALGTGALTIAGTGLTLSTNAARTIPNAIILNNDATIANGTHAFTANGAITGTGKLTKTGTGTLTLGGANTYTGMTTISAGTLQVGDGGSTGSIGSGNITLSLGATLAFNRSDDIILSNQWNSLTGGGTQTLRNDGTGLVTLAGSSNNIGSNDTDAILIIAGSGNGLIEQSFASGGANLGIRKEGSGTWIFTNDSNNYSGGTTISSGMLQIGNGGSTGTIGTGNIDLKTGATLAFNRNNSVSINNTWNTLTGGGTQTLRNDGTGLLTIAGSSGNIGGDNEGEIETLVLSGSGNGLIEQSFAKGGAVLNIQKDGAGTWTLSNTSNGFSGTTTIVSGTLEITGQLGRVSDGVYGNYAQEITNDGQLHINSTSSQTLSGSISGSGLLRKSANGILTLSGNNTYSGGTVYHAGGLIIGNDNALGTGNLTISGNNLTLSNTGSHNIPNAIILNNDLSIASGSDSLTLTGNISGSGKLSKTETGILTLTGSAHTYTGATEVINGELRVNGDISSSESVTVEAGATLSGTGTFPAMVVKGTQKPGNSPGIHHIQGALTYEKGAELEWELSKNAFGKMGVDYDGILVEGPIKVNGPMTLSLVFNDETSEVDWKDSFWSKDTTLTWPIFELIGEHSSIETFHQDLIHIKSDWKDKTGATFNSVFPHKNITPHIIRDQKGIKISLKIWSHSLVYLSSGNIQFLTP